VFRHNNLSMCQTKQCRVVFRVRIPSVSASWPVVDCAMRR
jgi:hypothetical protein